MRTAGPGMGLDCRAWQSRQMTESTGVVMAVVPPVSGAVTDGPDRWIGRRTSG